MYICENGHLFDEPVEITEYMGHGIYETYGVCPECGATFDEAEQCKGCGDWFAPGEVNADGLCSACELLEEAKYYDDNE